VILACVAIVAGTFTLMATTTLAQSRPRAIAGPVDVRHYARQQRVLVRQGSW